MTTEEFIRQAAANQGNSVTETRYWVGVLIEELKRALIDEEKVTLFGLGNFQHKEHKGRTMKNLKGEQVQSQDSILIKFVPSIYIRDAVKDGLNSVEFERRMGKIRALKRGEYVPGAYLSGGRVINYDIRTGERLTQAGDPTGVRMDGVKLRPDESKTDAE